MIRLIICVGLLLCFVTPSFSQTQPLEKPEKGYRFQHRIKGPTYKKSKILEIMVDEYGNYLVATFRGEKSSFVYLIVYNLYTWDEKYNVKLDDNRCELYNSSFDESGEFLYVNYDIYKNMFKKLNLETGEIEEVDCSVTPKGCLKIEPEYYKVDAYTVGDNYYIHRDEKLENYMRVLVKKEMYIPKGEEEFDGGGFGGFGGLDPEKGGVIQVTPQQIRDLKAEQEVTIEGVPIFYDKNAIDANGDEIPYEIAEGDPYKIRLTTVHINKLDKKTSFLYDKFVLKLDLDAWEAEMNQ